VSQGSKLCATFLNIAKFFKTVRCGCGALAFYFFNLLKTSTVVKVFDGNARMPIISFFFNLLVYQIHVSVLFRVQ